MTMPAQDQTQRRIAQGVLALLQQRKQDRAILDRVDDLAHGAAIRAVLIYAMTGCLSSMIGTLLGMMIWRALL